MARVLVVSPIPTHPLSAGNHARVYSVLQALEELGHRVTLLHVPWCPGSRRQMQRCWGAAYIRTGYRWPRSLWLPVALSRATQALGLSCLHHWTRRHWLRNRPLDLWYDDRVARSIERLHAREQFDAVIVVTVIWSRALEQFGSGIRKIIDSQDVLTDRYRMILGSNRTPRFWPWGSVSLSESEERRGLSRADVVLAIQPEDARRFREMTDRSVVTVGHLLPPLRPVAASEGADLLFVGSAWAPNVDGVQWFSRTVLPQLRRDVPSARLLVAGAVARHVPRVDGCRKLGVVRDLRRVYAGAAIVINPVREGTGLAVKSIEALAHGRVLVASPAGARGLESARGRGLVVADSPEAWRETLCALLQDRPQRELLEHEAVAFAHSWNATQIGQLQTLLE
jgi:glycosyltransferase involved in cell wall biosynthesis